MNYISDKLDLNLFQFGPLSMSITEISVMKVLGELENEEFSWALETNSTLKQDLSDKGLLTFFEGVGDTDNFELTGYNTEGKILIIVSATDSHLSVAGTGFRYFLAQIEKKEINLPHTE